MATACGQIAGATARALTLAPPGCRAAPLGWRCARCRPQARARAPRAVAAAVRRPESARRFRPRLPPRHAKRPFRRAHARRSTRAARCPAAPPQSQARRAGQRQRAWCPRCSAARPGGVPDEAPRVPACPPRRRPRARLPARPGEPAARPAPRRLARWHARLRCAGRSAAAPRRARPARAGARRGARRHLWPHGARRPRSRGRRRCGRLASRAHAAASDPPAHQMQLYHGAT